MFHQILPKILPSTHKGQNGRIAIIGGCLEYTGAPFYSAISALKGGCDLSHIFCTKDSAIPIKSYSPEVIVHPYLSSSNETSLNDQINKDILIKETISNLNKWTQAFHSYVIGPGLGRDEWIGQILKDFIKSISQGPILVLDADALWHLGEQYKNQNSQFLNKLTENSEKHILTPNMVEFKRLYEIFCGKYDDSETQQINQLMQEIMQKNSNKQFIQIEIEHPIVQKTVYLSQKLNNIIIIHKGFLDIITNGKKAFLILEQSGFKRCGGQGDILTGLLGVYSFWAFKNYNENQLINENESVILGCILACLVTRKASFLGFQKYKLSLSPQNIIDCIGDAFQQVSQCEEYFYSKL